MIELDGVTLTIKKIQRILEKGEKVAISENSMARVRASRMEVDRIVAKNEAVYGITTGFGKLSDVYIDQEHVESLQKNLIRSHACAVGTPLPANVVKTMMALRANALIKGFSGVRPVLIERLIKFINENVIPVVPAQGSLGASGDLAPLSHLALALMGEGSVHFEGGTVPAKTAHEKLNIEPLQLTAKEGLALINGTQAMTAIGIVAVIKAAKLAYSAEAAAALTMEALEGIITAFDADIHSARGYAEQSAVARRMREYLKGSTLITLQGEKRIQDAYSLRCLPQVHGASWQSLNYAASILETEMNAATDNPLIFEKDGKVISGGNFHGQPVALAMDFLKIGMAELANISERRTERLVNPQLNDLPAFLSHKPGVESGLMILQYAAASIVSENKTLAHPASVDSIPSSANQEDHVSMGTTAARHCSTIIDNLGKVLAIEIITALQALEFRDRAGLAPNTKKLYQFGRTLTAAVTEDRSLSEDIERVADTLVKENWMKHLIIDEEAFILWKTETLPHQEV